MRGMVPRTDLSFHEEDIASANTGLSTRATRQNAVKADIDERTKLTTFVSCLKQALLVAFAGSIDTLADFGLTARKVAVLRANEPRRTHLQ